MLDHIDTDVDKVGRSGLPQGGLALAGLAGHDAVLDARSRQTAEGFLELVRVAFVGARDADQRRPDVAQRSAQLVVARGQRRRRRGEAPGRVEIRDPARSGQGAALARRGRRRQRHGPAGH